MMIRTTTRFCGALTGLLLFLLTAPSADAQEYALVQDIPLNSAGVADLEFSPDGKLLVFANRRGITVLKRNNAGRFKKHQYLNTHASWVIATEFRPDGSMLSAGRDHKIIYWKQRDNNFYKAQVIDGHKAALISLSVSRNGNCMVATDEKGELRIYDWQDETREKADNNGNNDIETWKFVESRFEFLQSISTGLQEAYALCLSTDGQLLAWAGEDKSVRLWQRQGNRYKRLQTLGGFKGRVNDLLFLRDGKYLITAGKDMVITVWERGDDGLYTRLQVLDHNHVEPILRLEAGDDDTHFYTAAADGMAKVFEFDDGKFEYNQSLLGHNNWVTGVAAGPGGRYIATGSRDKWIKIWKN